MKHFCSFSEAIREGAKLRPQGFGLDVMREAKGLSCALEAAMEAIGEGWEWCDQDLAFNFYPYMATEIECPECCERIPLFDICWHLNDDDWTREAVADWLQEREEDLGFVLLTEEPEALKQEEGFYPSTSQAQAGVSK